MSDNDRGSSFSAVWTTSSIKLCDYTQNPHLQTWNDSTPVMVLKNEWQSHVYLYSWEYLWDATSHLTAVFFCFDALQACHICDLKSYDLSSSLWTQQIWCVSWITSNISSVWSWFISESVTLSTQHDKQSLSAKCLPQVNVKKEDKDTLNTSALPTASHRHRPHFKGMP